MRKKTVIILAACSALVVACEGGSAFFGCRSLVYADAEAVKKSTTMMPKDAYGPKGKRDPFVPLVGQEKSGATGLEDVTSVADINLEGIAIGAKGKRIAIMNGEMVKENDKVGNLEIKKISSKSVVLFVGGKEYTLNLQEEGGIKGGK